MATFKKEIITLCFTSVCCGFIFGFAKPAHAELDERDRIQRPEIAFCEKNFPLTKKDKRYNQCLEAFKANSFGDRQFQLGILFLQDDVTRGREFLTEAAKHGSAEAMYALAQSYEIDEEFSSDPSLVIYWYRCAAEHGHALAQARLADIYYYGQGVPRNFRMAFRWYYRAAHNNIPESQFALAKCYEKGEGTHQDFQKAFEWYLRSAEQGNVAAFVRLGDLFYYAEFGRQDYPQAAMWYKKAAEFGDAYAQFQYGAMLASGIGVKQHDKQAFFWLGESADQDYMPAQSLLGRLWFSTHKKENFHKAYKLLQRASFKGDSLSSLTLGRMYRRGDWVKQDFRESAYYFQRAMPGEGQVQAEALLGLSYHQGLGKPKNYHLAAICYTKAARQGNVLAQFNLSTLYAEGKGVERSLVKAYAWATAAASSGLQSAIEARRLIGNQLTFNQLDEAQKLAVQFTRN